MLLYASHVIRPLPAYIDCTSEFSFDANSDVSVISRLFAGLVRISEPYLNRSFIASTAQIAEENASNAAIKNATSFNPNEVLKLFDFIANAPHHL